MKVPVRRTVLPPRRRALGALLPPGFRLRGAVERPVARRRRVRAERRTYALGGVALGTAGAVTGIEVARAWRKRPARAGGPPLVDAVRGAASVAVTGYRGGTTRENTLLNMLASFTLTWAIARASAHAIRKRGTWGPFRNLVVGEQHIHHFVPGIVLGLVAGGVAIATRDNERMDPFLAVPFGVGAALTLDESALLLKLDDVYWTEDGVVSVQISLAAVAMLSALVLALRVLRRGEEEVLGDVAEGPRLR
ncbi:MAG: hypothetical protein M3370_02210 [Actinomycetota bacterium]|nr:hypothetical protein [Actinomycetota bacterium]